MGNRTALVLEHDNFSYPGSFGEGAERLGFSLEVLRVDQAASIPDSRNFDVVMVMGSLWSVYDPDIQGWLQPELNAIRTAVSNQVPVLGVCFGAQALSAALGGTVFRAEEEEIGWRMVETRDTSFIDPGPWFEWHHDSFTLPPGASLVASNSAGIQAFAVDQHLAVQFHPEITPQIVRQWIADGAEDLERARVDADELLVETDRVGPERVEAAQRLLQQFLTRALGACTPR